MRTAIEEARIELAKWEARVTDDEVALATAEGEVEFIRDRLTASKRTTDQLRYAVQQWDKLQADRQARGLSPLA